MFNSTVSGNEATAVLGEPAPALYAGGIELLGGEAELRNVTLTDNTADNLTIGGGGIVVRPGIPALIANTILADNRDASGTPDCRGRLTSEGFNLLGVSAGCTLVDAASSDLVDMAPLLGALSDNGGPTETHALLPGSPAIDRGNPAGCLDAAGDLLEEVQRQAPRHTGVSCDIGAYEAECADAVPPTQGNVLRAVKAESDVQLTFPGAPAPLWRLYRDTAKSSIGSTALVPDALADSFTDRGAVAPPSGVETYYDLRGLSPCSRTAGP